MQSENLNHKVIDGVIVYPIYNMDSFSHMINLNTDIFIQWIIYKISGYKKVVGVNSIDKFDILPFQRHTGPVGLSIRLGVSVKHKDRKVENLRNNSYILHIDETELKIYLRDKRIDGLLN